MLLEGQATGLQILLSFSPACLLMVCFLSIHFPCLFLLLLQTRCWKQEPLKLQRGLLGEKPRWQADAPLRLSGPSSPRHSSCCIKGCWKETSNLRSHWQSFPPRSEWHKLLQDTINGELRQKGLKRWGCHPVCHSAWKSLRTAFISVSSSFPHRDTSPWLKPHF